MDEFKGNFPSALADYLWLLDRRYPEKGSLKLVSDRYRLNAHQRTILYRGATSRGSKPKLSFGPSAVELPVEGGLFIDTLNVVLTIANYLYGRCLFISMDGFVRDDGELYRMPEWDQITSKALGACCRYLISNKQKIARWYIDSSSSLCGPVKEYLESDGPRGLSRSSWELRIAEDVDRHISRDAEIQEDCGGRRDEKILLAGSDREISAGTSIPVVDLAARVLTDEYSARLPDLRDIR